MSGEVFAEYGRVSKASLSLLFFGLVLSSLQATAQDLVLKTPSRSHAEVTQALRRSQAVLMHEVSGLHRFHSNQINSAFLSDLRRLLVLHQDDVGGFSPEDWTQLSLLLNSKQKHKRHWRDLVALFSDQFNALDQSQQKKYLSTHPKSRFFYPFEQERLDNNENRQVQCELPLSMDQISVEEYRQATHFIFFDDSAHAKLSFSRLQEIWVKQAKILKQRIVDLGVEEEKVRLVPLSQVNELLDTIKEPGLKRIYIFGHAAPLAIRIGTEVLEVSDYLKEWTQSGTQAVTHYGCSFIGGLEPQESDCKPGLLSIEIGGHRKLSLADHDDDPCHPSNPLEMVRVLDLDAFLLSRGQRPDVSQVNLDLVKKMSDPFHSGPSQSLKEFDQSPEAR